MGSDMSMNPPQKQWENHKVDTEEGVFEWVIGAMANDYEVHIYRASKGWIVGIFKGVWI